MHPASAEQQAPNIGRLDLWVVAALGGLLDGEPDGAQTHVAQLAAGTIAGRRIGQFRCTLVLSSND
jgi:hypothetical protein